MLDFQRPDNRFVQIHGLTLTMLLQDVIAHINLQSRNYENECYLNVNLFLTLYSFRFAWYQFISATVFLYQLFGNAKYIYLAALHSLKSRAL